MGDDQLTDDTDLRDVEAELCRLPDVVAARIVADAVGRPVEVHVLAQMGKHAKQVVRDIQSVALASFGLELDRRIVSVVQLGPNGSESSDGLVTGAVLVRPRIVSIEAQTTRLRTTIRVAISIGDEEAIGFAEGSVALTVRPRLVASAALDALRQLQPAADRLDLDAAQVARIGAEDVVVVTIIDFDPPHEQRLAGSAIVHSQVDDATVRAVLDATNRRLPFLANERSDT